MRVNVFDMDNRYAKRGIVDINAMTIDEATILFKTLSAVENPKPFIKVLIVNLKKKLFTVK